MTISFFKKNTILLVIILSLAAGCRKEESTPREYPTIRISVRDVSGEGVTFYAEIKDRGDHFIKEYGFVWGSRSYPGMDVSERVVHNDNLPDDHFSDRVSTTLIEGEQYFVYPYIITDVYTVYGREGSFVSLGSSAPVITGFEPSAANWGDTIKISGNRFSYLVTSNVVRLGDFEAEVVACTDSTIQAIVPSVRPQGSVSVSVTIAGNTANSALKFTVLPPVISSVNPLLANLDDTIQFKGSYLDINPAKLKINIGGSEAKVISTSHDCIKALIPTDLKYRKNLVSVKIGGVEIESESFIELRGPQILSISKDTIRSIDETLTIYGRNFSSIPGNNLLMIGGVKATVLGSWCDSINTAIPAGLIPDIYYSISKSISISVTTTQQTDNYTNGLYFIYKGAWSVKKNFPGTPRYEAVAFSINGKGYITTGKSDFDSGNLNDLWEYDPEKDEWTRKRDFPGSPRGAASSFIIGGYAYVGLGSGSGYYRDFFRYDPATDTWESIADFPGTARHRAASFVLDGIGYTGTGSNAESYYMTDIWKYNPETDSWSEGPTFTGDEFYAGLADFEGLTLNGSGYLFIYNYLYRLDGAVWTDMRAPFDMTAWDNLAFTYKGRAYIGMGCPHASGGTGYIWEWNPAVNSVTRLNNYFENARQAGSVFVIGERVFITGGHTMNSAGTAYIIRNDVWEYDPNVPVRF